MRTLRRLIPLLAVALALAPIACTKQKNDTVLKANLAPAKDPERVVADAKLTNTFVQADANGEAIARIRIATQGTSDEPRPPARVALVVDTSSSMEGEGIERAREATMALIEALGPNDQLTIVTFGSEPALLSPLSPVGEDRVADLKGAVDKMEAHGTTDMAGGLDMALRELGATPPDDITRVVLLSDGVPNDEARVVQLGTKAASSNVPIVAFGVGIDFQETLLADLAKRTGGDFSFVEDTDTLAANFRDEVLSIDRIVARSMTLTLRPGPGVHIREVVGHAASPNGRGSTVSLGDLAEGDTRDVVVKLGYEPHVDGATVELFDGVLAFQDAVVGAGPLDRKFFVGARSSADAGDLAEGRRPEIEVEVARATAAAQTLEIVGLARSGNLAAALARLDAAESTTRSTAKELDDDTLNELLVGMSELRESLPSFVPTAVVPAPVVQGSAVQMQDASGPAPSAAPEPSPAIRKERNRRVRRNHARAFKQLNN